VFDLAKTDHIDTKITQSSVYDLAKNDNISEVDAKDKTDVDKKSIK
jgi:hypothetical protein